MTCDSSSPAVRYVGTKHGTGDVPPDVRHEVSPTRPGALGDGIEADDGKATVRGPQQLRLCQHRRWVGGCCSREWPKSRQTRRLLTVDCMENQFLHDNAPMPMKTGLPTCARTQKSAKQRAMPWLVRYFGCSAGCPQSIVKTEMLARHKNVQRNNLLGL